MATLHQHPLIGRRARRIKSAPIAIWFQRKGYEFIIKEIEENFYIDKENHYHFIDSCELLPEAPTQPSQHPQYNMNALRGMKDFTIEEIIKPIAPRPRFASGTYGAIRMIQHHPTNLPELQLIKQYLRPDEMREAAHFLNQLAEQLDNPVKSR